MTKKELEAKLAEAEAGTAAKAKPAAKTKTVKLPPMLKLDDPRVGIEVDPTYPRNLAVFKLKADGDVVTKSDGTVKKPTRVPAAVVKSILAHPDEMQKLITASEEVSNTNASA